MDVDRASVVRAAVARLNAGDVEGYLAGFAPACPHWIPGSRDPLPMPAFVDGITALRQGLPDLHLREVTLFTVDQFVTVHWRTTGTHTGDLFGVPATHRRISFDTAEVYEVDGAGRVAASWAFSDLDVLLRQVAA